MRLWARVGPTPTLAALQGKIEQAVVHAGAIPEGRRFQPHVSLARLKDGRRLADYLAAYNLLHLETVMERFVLFSSHLGHGDPHYRIERVYPLAGQAP